jgi:hypothetical protein
MERDDQTDQDREAPVTEPQRQASSMIAMDSTEQPYGVRGCALRDPVANLIPHPGAALSRPEEVLRNG